MERIIDVAAYMARRYNEMSGEKIDEMKLHKLLYFTQREAIAITGNVAFECEFEGWKFGPVCREVRTAFCEGDIIEQTHDIGSELKYIVNNILTQYGILATWRLSALSHKETSWINSRVGLDATENGNRALQTNDIITDSRKIRPYDSFWDMYYDEFDDEGELS